MAGELAPCAFLSVLEACLKEETLLVAGGTGTARGSLSIGKL
jgi:hypothetical protein